MRKNKKIKKIGPISEKNNEGTNIFFDKYKFPEKCEEIRTAFNQCLKNEGKLLRAMKNQTKKAGLMFSLLKLTVFF